tara:strand:+ start:821 stop:1048 length:228 start_codon:yes stop_codon:yes gene_type:complete
MAKKPVKKKVDLRKTLKKHNTTKPNAAALKRAISKGFTTAKASINSQKSGIDKMKFQENQAKKKPIKKPQLKKKK